MRFLDVHVHLSDFATEEQLSYARRTGTRLVAAGVDAQTSSVNLELGSRLPGLVLPFVGVHPSEAEKAPGAAAAIERMAAGAAGIGEIGLDPKYSPVGEGSAQIIAFRSQLETAEREGKPVQVHSRDAEEACVGELATYRCRSVLLHWFEGEEMLEKVQGRGYYVSVGPALLYSKRLQRIAARSDQDLLLTESDGPVPYGPLGGVFGPFLVPSVVLKLAELRRASFEEMAERVAANGERFLADEGKG